VSNIDIQSGTRHLEGNKLRKMYQTHGFEEQKIRGEHWEKCTKHMVFRSRKNEEFSFLYVTMAATEVGSV
jgi:hypothetical protein